MLQSKQGTSCGGYAEGMTRKHERLCNALHQYVDLRYNHAADVARGTIEGRAGSTGVQMLGQ